MADDNRSAAGQDEKGSSSSSGAESAGDPGRTPGSAEGDRETVEEDLQDKENAGQL